MLAERVDGVDEPTTDALPHRQPRAPTTSRMWSILARRAAGIIAFQAIMS